MVLKTRSNRTDLTGQPDRFNREPAFNPVRLWVKTKNCLKIEKIRKPTGSMENRESAWSNRLLTSWDFLTFSQPKTTSFWPGT